MFPAPDRGAGCCSVLQQEVHRTNDNARGPAAAGGTPLHQPVEHRADVIAIEAHSRAGEHWRAHHEILREPPLGAHLAPLSPIEQAPAAPPFGRRFLYMHARARYGVLLGI
jgi:hypothetical protein